MQSADSNATPAHPALTDAQRLFWRPLPLANVLGQSDYAGFTVAVIWFAITAVCIWWAMVSGSFNWNLWHVDLFGTPVVFGFYLPWSLCVLLVMWFGLEWAAVPAYLATLFGTLHASMPIDLAVVNALHNPLAMAVYFLFYCGLRNEYSLRSRKSWLIFIAASLLASIVSSIGAFISEFNVAVSGAELWSNWMGWWPNAFLQALFIDGPVIYLLSPVIERAKLRYFKHMSAELFSMQKLLLAVSMFVLCLALFILVDDRWQDMRAHAILTAPLSDGLRAQIQTQFNVQHFVVWVLALLLAGTSLGGAIIAGRWAHRLHERADSETREVRDEIRRSEVRFRNFFERNPVPMWAFDSETGRFLEVNPAAVRVYGYSRDEFLNMTIFDTHLLEDIQRIKQQFKPVDASEPFRHAGEWRQLRKDGSLIHAEVHVSSMKMDGRPVNLALLHDISPRKQVHTAMEKRTQELRILTAASLEMAGAQTIEQVLQLAADRTRQLIRANLAVTHNWGRGSHEQVIWRVSLAPQYARWADFRVSPDGSGIYKLVMQKLHPVRLTRTELLNHPQFHGFGKYPEKHPPLNGLIAVPLTTRDGAVTGALMASDKIDGEFDIQDEVLLMQLAQTASVSLENVQLNDALHRHMQELEQRVAERTQELDISNRELDAFAYSVAHDLRAPLRAMYGFANAILEDYSSRLDEDGRNYLTRIVNAARNMDLLIQDLLAYSRIGRAYMVMEGVRLDDLTEEVLAELAPDIEMRRAVIRVDVPSLLTQAHRGTLKQVILNLVSNAIKFVAPGKRPEVSIHARACEGWVEMTVSDNGIGISAEHHERIFNVFERLHGADAYPGTGIGLSIVKKGLARMYGEIHVESGETGSTFRVRLKESRHE